MPKGDHGRFLLGYILPLVRKIEKRLKDLDFVSEAWRPAQSGG